MRQTNELFKAINQFVESSKLGIQLDIVSVDGPVILHIFHNRDIIKWDFGVDFGLEDGYVILLRFSKAIDSKDQYINKFLLTDFFYKFCKFKDFEPKDSYFTFLKKEIELVEFHDFIVTILSKVYFNEKQITISLNAPY